MPARCRAILNQAGAAARSAERLIDRGIGHIDPLGAREEVSPLRVCGLPQEGIPRRKDGTYAHGMSEEMTYAHLGRSGLLVSRIGLGTMNFGYHRGRAEQFRGHGRGGRGGHQPLRHRRRLRRPAVAGHEEGLRRRGGDRRPVAAAQRAPRRHRPGHEGLPADGTRPERPPAVRLPHPARLRGEPAAAADRSHRPVPDAPRRPGHAVGGDLAGDGAVGPRGQDHATSAAATSPAGTSPSPSPPPRHGTSSA